MEFTWRIFLRLVAELYGVQRESLCKGEEKLRLPGIGKDLIGLS